MNNQDFNIFAKKRFEKCMNTLQGKNAEYMRNDNKFHNFVCAGDMMGVSGIQALMGMKIKHTVSIMDIVKDYEERGILPSKSTLSEKIGDEINYLVILEAMFNEIIDKEQLLKTPVGMCLNSVGLDQEIIKNLVYDVLLYDGVFRYGNRE